MPAAWRVRRSVDEFERARAVERMEALPWPAGIAVHHAMNELGVSGLIQACHFRYSNSGAISATTVLNRTPHLSITQHDGTGRTRGCLIDQNGICRVRLPWAMYFGRRKQ